MLRLIYLLVIGFAKAVYHIIHMRRMAGNIDGYTEEERYAAVRAVSLDVTKYAFVELEVRGKEHLPETGGYILYANHQGRYDPQGIIAAHERPLSVVLDSKRAKMLVLREMSELVGGKPFVRGDLRQQAVIGKEIVKEIEETGKRFMIFPEGIYSDNKNTLQEFHAGSFGFAKRAKCPIIPTALIDSYRVFGENSLRRVRVTVSFLEPIFYDEYKSLTTAEISDRVKGKIQAEIQKRTENIKRRS